MASNKNIIPLASLGHIKRTDGSRPDVPGLYSDTCYHGDCSGSMSSMGRSPEDGGRHFAERYRTLGKSNAGQTNTHLTYGVFSTKYKKVFEGDPGDMTQAEIDACAIAMRPTNMTNFYDTTVAQITAQGKRIREAYSDLPLSTRRLIPLTKFASVIFAILTDGMDNESVLHNGASMRRALDRHKKEFGAQILFIAANMSAQEVGAKYGIDEEACLQMGSDQQHSQEAFRAVTNACLRQASSGAAQYRCAPPAFTPLERMTSCGANEALRHGVNRAHPVQGRQCTAPVQGTNGKFVQPRGPARAQHIGMLPPPPTLPLRRQNAMNPLPFTALAVAPLAFPQGVPYPTLPQSDDDLSDDE